MASHHNDDVALVTSHQGDNVDYEVEEKDTEPNENDEHRKRRAKLKLFPLGAPTSKQSNENKSILNRLSEDIRKAVQNLIENFRIIIISYFINDIYDIVIFEVGSDDIVFALLLIVSFIVWLWISVYIKFHIAKFNNRTLNNYISFLDSTFILLVVRYVFGVVASLFPLAVGVGVFGKILVAFVLISFVFMIVEIFGNDKGLKES